MPPLSLFSARLENREASVAVAAEAAALLGRRTAELHLALGAPTAEPDFAPIPMTRETLALDAHRIEAHLDSILGILKSRFATFDEATTEAVAQVIARRRALLARITNLGGVQQASNQTQPQQNLGQLIRVHGDYHLGQTLRTAPSGAGAQGDFVLLDFEGEPARSVAERRQKHSPLKDVAGMLRSFSYAAYLGLDQFVGVDIMGLDAPLDSRAPVAAWARFWERSITSEFLFAYRDAIAANPNLLPPQGHAQALLDAYLLEKALYEVQYELNNRPAWLRIPLAGILAL